VKYNRLGYSNAKALLDGVEGWKKAGYRVLQEPP
jgi:rhodanese-related sulfurtransferase